MERESTAYQLIKFAWQYERVNSYSKINSLMQDAVNLAIRANMQFKKDDFKIIKQTMGKGYWFGVNSNGKGYGECFYAEAIDSNNISAAKSYENFAGLKPFILEKKRVCFRFEFYDESYKYRVTGFDFEKGKITLIAYLKSDYQEKGSKKLYSFTNKEWLIFRKTLKY